jgi:hypothetical protein
VTLRREMRRYMKGREHLDEHALAQGFLRGHTKAALEPLIAEEFQHVRREMTRAREAEIIVASPPVTRRPLTRAETTAQLGQFGMVLDAEYRIGDGIRRRAGDLTVPEWKQRRQMLVLYAKGVQHAIDVCDHAIKVIEASGASTLRGAIAKGKGGQAALTP